GPRVRLDVRVLGAEEGLRAIDRRLLDLVHDVAAAVVALARVALGVLVRRHAAHGLEDAWPGKVLGSDQLDLAPLPLELLAEQLRNLGIDLPEAGGSKVFERLVRDGHVRHRTRQASRASTSAAGIAPSRRIFGSAPVRSTTVDAIPGSSPPSTRTACSRISSGISSSRRGSGPPWRFALVAATAPARVTIRRAEPRSSGTRTPIVPKGDRSGKRPS